MPSVHLSEKNPAIPNRLLLLTYPRTTSNLLLRLLAVHDQENIATNEDGGYHFIPAFKRLRMTGMPYKPVESLSKEEVEEIRNIYQTCLKNLEDASRAAEEQGKLFFNKEHALWLHSPATLNAQLEEQDPQARSVFRVQPSMDADCLFSSPWTWSPNNQTVLPDEYLRTWRLSFLIRNPVRAFPSYYRSILDLEKEGWLHPSEVFPHFLENMTLRWTRSLYDWSASQGLEPVVVDSDDIINDQSVVSKFADLLGLDSSKLKYSWSTTYQAPCAADVKKKPLDRIMIKTLVSSTGVLKDKSCEGIDIVTESEKWKIEFGQEMGASLEKYVRAAMPDYEYLRAKCLRGQQ